MGERTSSLRADCTLGYIVNIGQMNRRNKTGCPKIGNRVFIGAGDVIVGKIVIGDNVLIAPNAFVNFDVPDNSIVIGNPAVVKYHAIATEGYVNYVLTERNS
jgi:serine O-acetyltransferase